MIRLKTAITADGKVFTECDLKQAFVIKNETVVPVDKGCSVLFFDHMGKVAPCLFFNMGTGENKVCYSISEIYTNERSAKLAIASLIIEKANKILTDIGVVTINEK